MRATQGNEPFDLRADSAKGKSSNCMGRTLRVTFGGARLRLCHRTLLMKWRQCSPGPIEREASYFFRSPRGHASSLANFRDAFGLDQARRVHERSLGAPSLLPVSIKEPRGRVHVIVCASERTRIGAYARGHGWSAGRFTRQSSALRRDIDRSCSPARMCLKGNPASAHGHPVLDSELRLEPRSFPTQFAGLQSLPSMFQTALEASGRSL
jgi:hypothetical protein